MTATTSTSRKPRHAALGLAALALAGAAQAATFELASRRSDGAAPSFYSDGSNQPAVTPDGRYVVFTASATNLVTPDAAGYQIYLRDRVLGTTELISASISGGAGNNSSSGPSISDDGCRVVFMSNATDLVAGDGNGLQDVFLRSRCGGPATTTLVSRSTAGIQATASSYDGRISPDGSKVAFVSYATNLVGGLVGAGDSCLFVRNLNAATTSAVTAQNGHCVGARAPDLSYDGGRIAFWAYFVPGTSNVTNGVWQIYLYDFAAAAGTQPVVISKSAAGAAQQQGNEGSSTVTEPAISRDGGYVAFRSRGSGLVPEAVNGNSHVYLKEVDTGAIVLVSRSTAGVQGNADSAGSGSGSRPGLTDYAGTVTFLTSATNLAAETGGVVPNIVTHDPRSGVTRGYVNQAFGGNPGVSAGGTFVAAYSGVALDATVASRGMFLFVGEGDEDGDGIPNAVEFAEGRNPSMMDNDLFSPGSGSARLFAMQQYRDFLGREGDSAGIQGWTNLVVAGTYSRPQVIDAFINSQEFGGMVAPVVRLYFATFLRVPDYAGLTYNAALVRAGTLSVTQLADFFTQSPEFAATYGALNNTQFVTLLYQNVLGRAPDAAGLNGWVSLLNGGMSRGQVLVGFSESPEYQSRMASEVLVTMMYVGMLRRSPEPAGYNGWVAALDGGTQTREQAINGFFLSAEYRARFLP